MDKLKEEILKLTNDTKVITQKQLFHLLMVNKVKFTKTNYKLIISFLKENNIKMINDKDEKSYVLRK